MSADIVARGLAAAGARSANTQALVRAVRTNGFYPQPSWRTPAAHTATLTVPATGPLVSSYGASPAYTTPEGGKMRWVSGGAVQTGNADRRPRGAWYGANRQFQYLAYEFELVGAASFEHLQICDAPMQSGTNFRVLVNGRTAATASLPTDGAQRAIKVTFPGPITATVRVEVAGGGTFGVWTQSASHVGQNTRTYPLVTMIGDSFVEGTGGLFCDSEGIAAIRAIGCNPAMGGVGGTGLINPGSRTTWQDANRLSDLAYNGFTDFITGGPLIPAMGVVCMSLNDNAMQAATWGGAANFQDAVKKALWTLVDHWQANCPGRPLVVFGPTATNENPVFDLYRIRDAGQEVCAAAPNLWFIDRFAPGPILRKNTRTVVTMNGTLTTGSKIITALTSTASMQVSHGLTGTGIPAGARIVSVDSATQVTIDINATASGIQSLRFLQDQAALYTDQDGTHPNPAGHSLDALWMARELRELILTHFA